MHRSLRSRPTHQSLPGVVSKWAEAPRPNLCLEGSNGLPSNAVKDVLPAFQNFLPLRRSRGGFLEIAVALSNCLQLGMCIYSSKPSRNAL